MSVTLLSPLHIPQSKKNERTAKKKQINTKNLKIFQVSYVIQIKIPNFVPKLYIRAAVGAFTPRRKQDATIFYIPA